MRPSPRRTLSLGVLLIVVAMTAAAGCASGPAVEETNDMLTSRGIAAAASETSTLPPTVDDLLDNGGNVLTWAEQGFSHFDAGRYEMALPYLEAAIASGQASRLQRAYLYWFSALSHRELAQTAREVEALELFVLALDSTPEDARAELALSTVRGERLTLASARTRARARLFALRVERQNGFGSSVDQAIPVESFNEESLVLRWLRCGDARQGRVELVALQVRTIDERRFDVHTARCTTNRRPLDLVFDVTTAFRDGRPTSQISK